MRYSFYDSTEYKKAQAERTKQAWKAGCFENQLAKMEDRKCKRNDCGNIFRLKTYQQKDFCSQSCSAIYSNLRRGPLTDEWRNHKYCCVRCSMNDIGSRPTSPRAARAKSGIRKDISPNIYFFSRWEANFARIMNLLNIKWIFQPKTFDLKYQKYTPDFYLPQYNSYIEIKNFLSDYSLKRDQGFRSLYPKEKLILILKEDYLRLQEQFSSHIENWEFS